MIARNGKRFVFPIFARLGWRSLGTIMGTPQKRLTTRQGNGQKDSLVLQMTLDPSHETCQLDQATKVVNGE